MPDAVGADSILKDDLRFVIDGEVFFDGEAEGQCEERCEGDDPVENVVSF